MSDNEVLCFFCGEPIIKIPGTDTDSYNNHHKSYDPEIIVSAHHGCHTRHHNIMRGLQSDPLVTTCIIFTEEQHAWVQHKCINLSKFVRAKLEEEMDVGSRKWFETMERMREMDEDPMLRERYEHIKDRILRERENK